MTVPADPGWRLGLTVPEQALPPFEAALTQLGGALVTEGADPGGHIPVTVYLAERPDRIELEMRLALAAGAAGIAPPEIVLAPLPPTDWVAESHRGLPPIRAGRFYVFGAHVTAPPPPAALPIRIEANIAFGTGRHESTRGCLLALGDIARARRVRRPLDMGCGSGILAIAMAKLWRRPVMAVDNDRDAVRMTGENARDNRVAGLITVRRSEGYRRAAVARAGPYDLITANILAEPLMAMATDLAAHLAPGGQVVLAGLLDRQAGAVLARHRGQGLTLRRRYRLGDWTALVLQG